MADWEASVPDEFVRIDGTEYPVPRPVVSLLLHISHKRHESAFLGRELYEELLSQWESNHAEHCGHEPSRGDHKYCGWRIPDALACYEREVDE